MCIRDGGMVGMPIKAPTPTVIETLCKAGYVPVIACISASKNGKLFNVNADTLAGSLAALLVLEGHQGPHAVRRAGARILRALDGRAVGHRERELSRSVRAADSRRDICGAG